jgi:putative glutamine transport system substrate-binding protein
MKKLTAVILGITFSLGALLAGCGSSTSAPSTANSVPADIKAIKDRGTLKVGVKVDVPKFGFKDPKTNKIEGFEIDIAKAIAKKILGDENKVELQAVTAKTRGPLLDNGEVDMIAATFTIMLPLPS